MQSNVSAWTMSLKRWSEEILWFFRQYHSTIVVETICWFNNDNRSNNLFSDFPVCTRDAVHCFSKTMLWLMSMRQSVASDKMQHHSQLQRLQLMLSLLLQFFFCWITLSVLLVEEKRSVLNSQHSFQEHQGDKLRLEYSILWCACFYSSWTWCWVIQSFWNRINKKYSFWIAEWER